MKCPFCGELDSKVIDSRPAQEGASIRRRRECIVCKKRFTTYELVEQTPLIVIKRDGSRQGFDRVKLINGMIRACEKRPVGLDRLESIASEIETELHGRIEREVPTSLIGEMVMDRLKEIDDIAYIRFASVYRQFRDIDSLNEEISKLMSERKG